jgi:hypothetical protein
MASHQSGQDRGSRVGPRRAIEYLLLELPAVEDNGAMFAEPPNADLPRCKRRWSQFSLRSLLIFTLICAIPCGYLGWQAKIVRERKLCFKQLASKRGIGQHGPESLPNAPNWIRLALGDVPIESIDAPVFATDDELNEIRAMFPEAKVRVATEFEKRRARDGDPIGDGGFLLEKLNELLPRSTSKPAMH